MFEKRAPVDLTNARLRKLAAALGPAYVRVSGTWANSVFFQDTDAVEAGPTPSGYQSVLTRAQWAGVIAFTRAVDAKLVTSFAISSGVRDADGIWTPAQAQPLVAYTKSIGGTITAAELFNEPTIAASGGAPDGYTALTYARDEAAFRSFIKTAAPELQIVGPGSVGEGGVTALPKVGADAPFGGLARNRSQAEVRCVLLPLLRRRLGALRGHGAGARHDSRRCT